MCPILELEDTTDNRLIGQVQEFSFRVTLRSFSLHEIWGKRMNRAVCYPTQYPVIADVGWKNATGCTDVLITNNIGVTWEPGHQMRSARRLWRVTDSAGVAEA